MPKIVDHEERRRQIAEAVLRVTAKRGLEAASLRDVAAEGGMSMGRVQQYFSNKDEMLVFACAYMIERMNHRIAERIAASPRPNTWREILRNVFVEILPLDEERREGTRVWIAFLARASLQPALMSFMRDTWIAGHRNIADMMRAAQEHGEIPAECDPDRETVSALSLTDGLVSHILMGHYTEEMALQAIDDHLDRLFISESSA
ncbi:MAG TPA: TetR/AcrR family transcriptional regulator, partial [Nitrolancea sp.]|nr:TetR/AcrR family transcriptional regulator [Nitrolancea sp.]